MEPFNRQTFKEYIFRRLGYPVIQINVDDEQAEDRIDDALAFYQDYYPLGSERSLYVHEVTEEDVQNGYLTIPENITSVMGFLPATSFAGNFMSDHFQLLRTEYMRLDRNVSYSLIPYYVAMTRLADIEFLFGSNSISFNFNKYKRRVEIQGSNNNLLKVGNKIVMEVQAYIDPNQYSDVWKDRWLKQYATALMKRQWAENLKLFSGVQLIGGVTLDAQTMYQEANDEINTLQEKLIQSGMLFPLDQIA